MLSWLVHAKILEAGHASDWISGIIGAGGAIVGSLVSVTWTEYFSSKARRRERGIKVQIGTFAIYQRLNQIYSAALQVRKHIEQGMVDAAALNVHVCQRTAPILQQSLPVIFSMDELWSLTQVESEDLVNQINSIDHAYNGIVDAMRRYDVDRRSVEDRMKVIGADSSGVLTTLTEEELGALEPMQVALDSLLLSVRDRSIEMQQRSLNGMRGLICAPKKPLGPKVKLTLPLIDGSEITFRAEDAPRPKRPFEFWLPKDAPLPPIEVL